MVIEIIMGILAALLAVLVVAKLFPNKDHVFWRSGLLVAALVYVAFALAGQAFNALPMEISGVILYGFFVWLSKRKALYWLAIGWILHIAWDVFLHLEANTPFVPDWYPGVCLGFDIVIAAYIAYLYFGNSQQR